MTNLLNNCEIALNHAKRLGASAADVVAMTNTNQTMGVRAGSVETMERAESCGIGVRVFVEQASAILSSSDVSRSGIEALVENALIIAREAPADQHGGLADTALLAKNIPDLDLDDNAEPSMDILLHQARVCEDAGRSHAGISNTQGAECSTSRSHFALATSHGFAGHYATAHAGLSCTLIAGVGEHMQRDYGYATARKFLALPTPETIGHDAAKRTLAKLNPRKLESRGITIFFDPRVARSVLSAFLSAINGASIARGTSFLKETMGTAIFSPHVQVIDDPLRPGGLASRPFDGEGAATQARMLVENGVLQSWLLDSRSARQLGLASTGHASRGLSSAPQPSPSNSYIVASAFSPQHLLQESGEVFYVTETFGHGVNIVTGDYSQGAAGFYYANGEKQFAVSEVTIAGNLRDMFLHLTPANDLEFHYGINSPTLRIEGMTLAGAA